MKVRALAAVCAASLGLAACGGDSEPAEEEQGPAEVTEQFLNALVSGDGETGCSLVSEDGLEQLEADSGGESCAEYVEAGAADLPDDAAENAEAASYEVLEETDGAATVEVSRPGDDSETFNLVQENGEWKIEN